MCLALGMMDWSNVLLYFAIAEKNIYKRKNRNHLFVIYGFWSLILIFFTISCKRKVLWDRCNETSNIFIYIILFINHILCMGFMMEPIIRMEDMILNPNTVSQIFVFAKLQVYTERYIFMHVKINLGISEYWSGEIIYSIEFGYWNLTFHIQNKFILIYGVTCFVKWRDFQGFIDLH